MNDSFWDQLRALYEKEDGNIKAYESEKPVLQNVLGKIEEELSGIYDFLGPLGRGGAGVVVQLKDRRLDLYRALNTTLSFTDVIFDSHFP